MRTRAFWQIGLVLAALFIGHDLFMAGNAHATAMATDHHAAPAGHITSKAGKTCGAVPPTVHEAADCGSLQSLMPQTGDGKNGVASIPDRAGVSLAGDSTVHADGFGPHRPPGVRRAFLQVWRI